MRLDAGLEPTERALAAADLSGWERCITRIIEDCHPEQRDFVCDPGRYIAVLVGRNGGKTFGGMFRFVIRMMRVPGAKCVYLAKVKDHAKRLMWQPLKDLLKRLGFVVGRDVVYNETTLTCTLKRNGSNLRLCGADKPADVESMRGESYNEVGIDEGALHPDALLTDLIHSILKWRLINAIWVAGTPGKRLKGLFYEITRRGAKLSRLWKDRDAHPNWRGWSLHKWSLKSAIDATRDRPIPQLIETYARQLEEIETAQYSDDNPIKRREFDGEWASDDMVKVYRYRIHKGGDGPDAGELWNQWDPERIGPFQIAKLPTTFDDWAHVIAFDLGFSDPTSINVFAFSPSDRSRTIYHRLCFEQTGMYAQHIAHKLIGAEMDHEHPRGIIGAIGEWPNAMVADSAHQMAEAILAELGGVYGIAIERAVKGFRYKLGAIDVVNGDFFDGRIKVLKDSKLEAQLLDLEWDESRTGEPIERKGQPNHGCDCLIYGRAVIAKFLSAASDSSTPEPKDDPSSPDYEPPMPTSTEDFSGLFQDDYQALLG